MQQQEPRSANTGSQVGGRIVGLDVVRAVAILLVLVAHAASVAGRIGEPGQGDGPAARLATLFGLLAVNLFFVLSGSLIAGSLFGAIRRGGRTGAGYSWRDVLPLWGRRWGRTLPAFWLWWGAAVALGVLTRDPATLRSSAPWAALTFTGNLAPGVSPWGSLPAWSPVFWSLACEEAFYLLFPLGVLALSRLQLRTGAARLGPQSAVPVFCGPLVAGCFAGRLACAVAADWDGGLRKSALLQLDGIAVGVLVAYVRTWRPDLLARMISRPARVAAALGLVAVAGSVWLWAAAPGASFPAASARGVWMDGALFPVLNVAFAVFVARFGAIQALPAPIQQTTGHLAAWSYSCYLSHALLMFSSAAAILRPAASVPLRDVIWAVAMIGASLLIAAAAYWTWERPMLLLRDRFFSRAKSKRSIALQPALTSGM